MPSTVALWSVRFINPAARFLCRTLTLCLLSLTTVAQEPEASTESSAADNEASSSSSSSEAPLYSSRDIRDKSLLAKEIKDEALWLETEHGKILALYRPTEAKKTFGVLVLFHAAEDPQLWPPILENLRANLPRYGWETLAISLPHKYPATIPERPSSSSISVPASSAGDPTTSEAPEATSSSSSASSSNAASSSVARELFITAYVNAAFNFLNEHNQLNVVVLTDNSSVHQILQTLTPQIKGNKPGTTTIDGPLQALIITNLQPQESITKSNLEAIFNTEQLPVFDIFFAPDTIEQLKNRDLHRAIAMRKKISDYQQLLIDNQPKLTETDRQSYLLGRVRGFMKQKASGTEQTNRNATDAPPSQ